MLFEVLVALIDVLNLLKPLRKSSESVIWFRLAINVVHNLVNKLDCFLEVYLRLRDGYFLLAVGQITIIGIGV